MQFWERLKEAQLSVVVQIKNLCKDCRQINNFTEAGGINT
jgi:hypothetical protein